MQQGNVPESPAQALRWVGDRLSRAGVTSSLREARLILAHVMGCEPAEVTARDGRLDFEQRRLLAELAGMRCKRYPLPYLLGYVGFLDFLLCVRPGVFIPRPETEGLAERAVELAPTLPQGARVLDIGTGTGALAIALARARDDLRAVATDTSAWALRCAWENAWRLGVAERIQFRVSDLFEAVPERFHLVVTNPPYVPHQKIRELPPEVAVWEPRAALDGGEKGTEVLRSIIAEAPKHLETRGWLLCEIGHGQGEELLRFAKGVVNWLELRVEEDLAGRERYLIGCLGPMT
jgi:release factor glutamine methyltransferase